MTGNAIIAIDEVSFSYNGPAVLDKVNLFVRQGEFLGLVGPNGGGKSTLLKIILGLLSPAKGEIFVLGKPPKKGRAVIGYVPQYAAFERNFPITVEETVLLGRVGKTRMLWRYCVDDHHSVNVALQKCEINNLRHRRLNTLSGGQFQRVLIARALVSDPEILILDEPTANIDLRVEENIFDLLKKLNVHSTIIVVSHDIGFISEYVTRVACLNRTLVCHETAAISGKSIEELYGVSVHMIQHAH
ncbi:MAG: ABC transporter ATP-binding protein [Gammaproteobacteria bacterium]|nr:ABC transporter ATP-binding protein [Gammaproteobacteria bacterium]